MTSITNFGALLNFLLKTLSMILFVTLVCGSPIQSLASEPSGKCSGSKGSSKNKSDKDKKDDDKKDCDKNKSDKDKKDDDKKDCDKNKSDKDRNSCSKHSKDSNGNCKKDRDDKCHYSKKDFHCKTKPNGYLLISGAASINIDDVKTYSVTSTKPGKKCQSRSGKYYSWNVIGGVILSGHGTQSIQVKWTVAGGGLVKYGSYKKGRGVEFDVTVNQPLTLVITGPIRSYVRDTVLYTLTGANGTPNFPSNVRWITTGSGRIIAGQGTATVSIVWDLQGPNSVSASLTNVVGAFAVYNVTIIAKPIAPPAPVYISGNETSCETSFELFTATAGFASYSWSVTGGTITNGQGSNTIRVSWTGAGIATVSLVARNSAGVQSLASFEVEVGATSQAFILGDEAVCSSEVTAYEISESGDFLWTVSGGTIVGSNVGNSISVIWGAEETGTVMATNAPYCGNTCATTATLNVSVSSLQPIIIAGEDIVRDGFTTTYTIPTGADNYDWTVVGGVITSGQSTNTITIQWSKSTLAGRFGNVEVWANYGECSYVGAEKEIVVLDVPSYCTIVGSTNCQNSLTYTYNCPEGYESYNWSIPSGHVIVSGQGTSICVIRFKREGSFEVKCTMNGSTPRPVYGSCLVRVVAITIGGFRLAENDEEFQVNLYPNPTVNKFTIESPSAIGERVELRVTSVKGNIVTIVNERTTSTTYKRTVDMTNTASGTYLVALKIGATQIVKQLIKN